MDKEGRRHLLSINGIKFSPLPRVFIMIFTCCFMGVQIVIIGLVVISTTIGPSQFSSGSKLLMYLETTNFQQYSLYCETCHLALERELVVMIITLLMCSTILPCRRLIWSLLAFQDRLLRSSSNQDECGK